VSAISRSVKFLDAKFAARANIDECLKKIDLGDKFALLTSFLGNAPSDKPQAAVCCDGPVWLVQIAVSRRETHTIARAALGEASTTLVCVRRRITIWHRP